MTTLIEEMTSAGMNSQQEKHQRRAVSFSIQPPQILMVPSARHAWTAGEIDAYWYSTEDINAIIKESILLASSSSQCLDSDDTIRGLELMTPEGVCMTKHSEAVKRVLQAQAMIRERENGLCDIDALAEVERSTSLHRQRIAHLRGVQDAECVYGKEAMASNQTLQARQSATAITERRLRRIQRLRQPKSNRSASV